MAALLLGNLFIVGINQIYDVEIDEVNKPFLPTAAGRRSPRMAWLLVVSAAKAPRLYDVGSTTPPPRVRWPRTRQGKHLGLG